MQIICEAFETLTNFRVAEAVINLCSKNHSIIELDAETVAKMILLQLDARKGGVG